MTSRGDDEKSPARDSSRFQGGDADADAQRSIDCIQVAVRVRPFLESDRERPPSRLLKVESSSSISILGKDKSRRYNFDNVYQSFDRDVAAYSTNGDVYKSIGVPLVRDALKGYNGCLLAYGGTGSGKTYNMIGTDGDPGERRRRRGRWRRVA